MKLFVVDQSTGQKIYLKQSAGNRRALANLIGATHFTVNNQHFTVHDVIAEKSSDSTAIGMVVGGALGLLGGAPGVVLGGVLGGVLGKNSDDKEKQEADLFNGSGL